MELLNECDDHVMALEHLLQSSFNLIDDSTSDSLTPLSEYIDRVMSLKEEDERNLEGLKENVKELQMIHETNQQQIASVERKIEILKREKENLHEQKTLKKKSLARIKNQYEGRKNSVLKIEKLLTEDFDSQNTLNRNKNELLLYQKITGISWDYAAAPNLVKGYVTNKETGFLKPFCFNKEEKSSSQITEALWEIILSSSLEHCHKLLKK